MYSCRCARHEGAWGSGGTEKSFLSSQQMEVILLAGEEIPVPMEWEAEWTPTAGMDAWQDK